MGRTGEQLKAYKTGFEAALKRADREDFRFHDLRHSAGPGITATLLQATGVRNGVDLLTVKEFMGQKSLAMTVRYTHLSPDHKRAAAASLKFDAGRVLDTDAKTGNLALPIAS